MTANRADTAPDLCRIAQAVDYAARKHAGQRRRGPDREPYVNHVIDVACRVTGGATGGDETLYLGALLHDVIEDTDGTRAEIAGLFGEEVAALVMEVTDDRALPKQERKRMQVETTPTKSDRARRIKLADKTSNLTALVDSPPTDWDGVRKTAYVDWALEVVAGCRGLDPALEAAFDDAVIRARAALI